MDYGLGQTIGLSVLQVALVLLLSPLLEGVIRKLIAFVHSRIGPPLFQPYLDILKLLGKEEIASSRSFLFRYSAVIALTAVLTASLLVPMLGRPPLGFAGEVIVFVYLISVVAVMIFMSGVSSGSPYGLVGAGREVMMVLTVEPVLAIALITAAVKSGSMMFGDMVSWQLTHPPSISMVIVGVALFLAIVAQVARLPFDIVEADQEIMAGPFVEQSGPKLALFKWGFYAKQLIFASLLVSVFIPWPHVGKLAVDALITLAKVVVLLVLVGVVHAVNPRLRIDQSIQFFGLLIFASAAGLAFALVGS
ncbi:MAG: NADH-quinone oxidoreductase subunit H [bacterium]|jgi:formate hydrogenlyase subunit 4|nr:NADH-quinone oxidoreductase subunit H [candidate division KSB1 bacterium]MDH7558720.1 NADH-quinone oxidoreductase subunit H [bacterium]